MQGQQQTVRPLPPQFGDHVSRHLIQHSVGYWAGRRGPGHANGHRLIAFRFDGGEEAADLMMGVAPFVQHRGPKGKALGYKSSAVGAQWTERVRLVHEAGNGDAHGVILEVVAWSAVASLF